jgi:hypothetical protein
LTGSFFFHFPSITFTMSDNKRLSVKAGYCGDGTSNDQRCVLEQSDCADDELDQWRSSGQMDGAPYQGHGGYCLYADVVKDIVEDVEFGACQNASGDKRCSYADDQCVEGENWVFPVADCSCDQVRVGACKKDERVFCAVTEFGCDDASTWMDSRTVSAQAATDCYLCIAVTTTPDDVAAPTSAPVITPNNAPVAGTNSVAAAIGGALGGVLLLTLVSVSLIISSRKRKAKADAAVLAPPTKTFQTCNDDTVSNLDEEEFQDDSANIT